MKTIVIFALLLVCVNASIKDKLLKLIPSFPTSPYIIKGEEAIEKSAPYIVSLSVKFEKHSHICGGTIINKEWVLTAGHCIASKPEGMGVYAGLQNRLETDNPNAQHREIDFGKVHPKFQGGVGPYDIALLHVSTPFEFNDAVQPAAIPANNAIPSGEVVLYGWGQTKAFVFAAAKTLQTVKTEVIEWEECKNVLPESAPLDITNVCTSSLDKGISACNGDSGGPLVIEGLGGPSELIGIVSWGYIPCGYSNKPSIFTRVSAYVDWILAIQSAYYTMF